MLSNTTTMRLNFSLEDKFGYKKFSHVLSNATFVLSVNSHEFYYVSCGQIWGGPFTVKRSIRGIFLKIPSLHDWECVVNSKGRIEDEIRIRRPKR